MIFFSDLKIPSIIQIKICCYLCHWSFSYYNNFMLKKKTHCKLIEVCMYLLDTAHCALFNRPHRVVFKSRRHWSSLMYPKLWRNNSNSLGVKYESLANVEFSEMSNNNEWALDAIVKKNNNVNEIEGILNDIFEVFFWNFLLER